MINNTLYYIGQNLNNIHLWKIMIIKIRNSKTSRVNIEFIQQTSRTILINIQIVSKTFEILISKINVVLKLIGDWLRLIFSNFHFELLILIGIKNIKMTRQSRIKNIMSIRNLYKPIMLFQKRESEFLFDINLLLYII